MDIATFWEICLQFEYDKELLVGGLTQWLHAEQPDEILDCACGTGFPSLDLIKKGYNITCTDGSSEMLKAFKRNAQHAGLIVEPLCVLWQDLKNTFDPVFDIVMCRGSSLIYVNGWDTDHEPQESLILESLKNFFHCLRPGGTLYIDTTSEENLIRFEPEHSSFGPSKINDDQISLEEVVWSDKTNNLRTWHSTLKVNDRHFEFKRHSYFLPHDKLKDILADAGFEEIRSITIPGEHYAVFVAKKAK